MIEEIPIIRRITRRRPSASHSAIAHSTIGTSQSQRSEDLQDLRQVLSGLELIGLHDRDSPGVRAGAQSLVDPPDDRHLLPELDQDWLKVEHEVTALGADRPCLVLEDPEEFRCVASIVRTQSSCALGRSRSR